ncbi:hypothetical protein CRYUN_Cryun06bG0101000 [Craigia yunnanensis]
MILRESRVCRLVRLGRMDRMECRQWGPHLPHVAGIAGMSKYGAQSIALSGGYIDDEDHGEWFLYTGSMACEVYCCSSSTCLLFPGLLDLFAGDVCKLMSCKWHPYPTRKSILHMLQKPGFVMMEFIELRNAGVKMEYRVIRYADIFLLDVTTILPRGQGFDIHGDHPRPLPAIKELNAIDITERQGSPS